MFFPLEFIPDWREEWGEIHGVLEDDITDPRVLKTLDFGSDHDTMVQEIEPLVRLHTDSTEPTWDSLSVPLCFPLPYLGCLSLSLSLSLSLPVKINKH